MVFVVLLVFAVLFLWYQDLRRARKNQFYLPKIQSDKKSLIVAVDFDNTIAYTNWPEIIEEVPGAIVALNRLQQQGHIVVLWTCREDRYLRHCLDWLEERNFTPDFVNSNTTENLQEWEFDCRKVGADVYIDDRSFGCRICWKSIMTAFDNFYTEKNNV